MSASRARYLYSRFGTRQIADLLQLLFAAEVLAPSARLWIVSPWLSDIPVIDNHANGFSALVPDWPRANIRLSSVLGYLASRGTLVHVATRSDESHNRDFLTRLADGPTAETGNLRLHSALELHDKGILSDGFLLAGSMNFTYSGVSVNQEALHYTTDPTTVAEHQVLFRARWGD